MSKAPLTLVGDYMTNLPGSLITTKAELKQVAKQLEQAKIIAFDFETTGLDFVVDTPLGLSLKSDNGVHVYVPFVHMGIQTMSEEEIVKILRPAFMSPNSTLVAHNLKFDIQFLWDIGIDIGWKLDEGLAACTMIMAWLADENSPLGLKELAGSMLHLQMTPFSAVTEGAPFSTLPIDIALRYALLDSGACYEIYLLLKDQLEKENLLNAFRYVEMPYLKVLAKMERRGMSLDLELLDQYHQRIKEEIEPLEREMFEAAGRVFNIKSGDQLAEILFSEPPLGFGAPVQAYTEGGKKPRKDGTLAPKKPKTDADSIEALAKYDAPWKEFCLKLLRYKELIKIESTYIIGLRELLRADGKLHTELNQWGTVTGRISSSAPNLQNQPASPTWLDEYIVGQAYKIKDLWLAKEQMPPEGTEELVIPSTLEEAQKLWPKHKVEAKYAKEDKEKKSPIAFLVNRKIRDVYYNPYGPLVVSDYSQMEMRVMAHFSHDPGLMQAFESAEIDIHTWVASKVFKVPYDEVTKEMRSKAKAVGFGTIYGKTVWGFAKDWYGHESDFIIGYDKKTGRAVINKKYVDLAQQFLDEFFGAFQGVKKYMDECIAYCYKYGYVRTISGQKRRLPNIYSTKTGEKNQAGRQAVNTKIQGSAGVILKLAQINLEKRLEGTGLEQVLQVHDEIIITAPSEELAKQYLPIIKETLETPVKLSVPIISEPGIFARWGMAK